MACVHFIHVYQETQEVKRSIAFFFGILCSCRAFQMRLVKMTAAKAQEIKGNQQLLVVVFWEFCIASVVFAFLAPKLFVARTRRQFVLLSAVALSFSLVAFSCAVVCLRPRSSETSVSFSVTASKTKKAKIRRLKKAQENPGMSEAFTLGLGKAPLLLAEVSWRRLATTRPLGLRQAMQASALSTLWVLSMLWRFGGLPFSPLYVS